MRATTSLVLAVALFAPAAACKSNTHDKPEWLEAPESYDPVKTEGLTFNKKGLDELTLKEGEERDAYIEELKAAEGKFKGQAKCKGGSGTGDMEDSQHGEYKLTCDAGTILFDIELKYFLYTTKDKGRPLKANAHVEFGGTLVDFDYQDDSKPRSVTATVAVGENIERLN